MSLREALSLTEALRNKFGDPCHKIVLSIDGPKIEEDHRLKDLFRRVIEIDNPVTVITFPNPIGLAPFRIDGHNPALAAGKAALVPAPRRPFLQDQESNR